jgi:hypothetical protein
MLMKDNNFFIIIYICKLGYKYETIMEDDKFYKNPQI